MWVDGIETFELFFPEANLLEKRAYLGGFGGPGEFVDVYVIPKFEINDGIASYCYTDIPIAVTNRDFSFQMIASFTMFNKMNYEYLVNDKDTGIRLQQPYLFLNPDKDEYRSVPLYITIKDRDGIEHHLIDGLDVFLQEGSN